ncbi:MAG: trigger factor [Proteobacteria bacterium]|nr:trigger factor [Pseudomonadota bacterium]
MQVKELKSEGLRYEMEVTVTAKDIDKKIDERLIEVGKTVKMPGFRPGKVPPNILKQRYGKAVLGEVLESAVNDTTSRVIKDKKLRPALQPKIEVKEFDEGKDLVYTMALEVLPEFKVMDLKGIKLEKPVAKPEKKAVDEALDRIGKQRRESSAVDRAAKKGDIVKIDFRGRTADDDKEHPGMQGEGHFLELGSGQFIPGFEDQLAGKKKGDKTDVKVSFPKEYHAADLSGREAIFAVEVHEVREPKKTEIDDDFAKNLGFDNEKALRDAVEKQIKSEYDAFSRTKVKRALLDILDDSHEFPVPQGMLDLEFQSIMNQIKMERQSELDKDGNLKLKDDEEEELKAIAERRVRLGMILSEVGSANNVRITDQELQRAVISEAQKYPGQEAQVFEFFRSNRQALDSLRAPVFEDKVVDFILELADVTEKEVPLDTLTAAEDEESYLEKKKDKKSSGGAKKKPEESEDKPKAKTKR